MAETVMSPVLMVVPPVTTASAVAELNSALPASRTTAPAAAPATAAWALGAVGLAGGPPPPAPPPEVPELTATDSATATA